MNPIKMIGHIRKVGFKQFREEYNQKRTEMALDPMTSLRMQTQGYTGVILFSFVTMVIFAFTGFWTISGIFLFNMIIMSGQLLSVRNQLKTFHDMKRMQEVELMSEEEKKSEETEEKKGKTKGDPVAEAY